MSLSRQCFLVGGTLAAVAALVIACGSEGDSTFKEGEPPASNVSFENEAGFGTSSGNPIDGGDLYANDPPPKWCGPGGDPVPPPPGGTEACPDDKNKPGCGCTKLGEKAKCWTGLRKHRNIGVCKDGETTCIQKNETELAWGPCNGEVLPTAGATKGAAACACFSAGQWKIANLSPCTMSFGAVGCQAAGNCTVNAVSTIVDGNGVAQCPTTNPPTAAPTEDWSTDTLNVDCAGHFKLCLRIRAGTFETPSANDCILAEVCSESDYKVANVEQVWPNLPGWLGKDQACAKKWDSTPEAVSAGYAEMIVKGESVRCDKIDDGNGGDLIFNRVKYCPRSCNNPGNQNLPECVSCQQSGSGQF
jgi:hypothetical protein